MEKKYEYVVQLVGGSFLVISQQDYEELNSAMQFEDKTFLTVDKVRDNERRIRIESIAYIEKLSQ